MNVSCVAKPVPLTLFSKVGVGVLLIAMLGLFLTAQLLGIYLFTPLVLGGGVMTAAQRFGLGSSNGTVISYAMLFTLMVIIVAVYLVVKWRIRVLNEYCDNNTPDDISKNVPSNATATQRYGVADYLAIKRFAPRLSLVMLGLWFVFLILSEALTVLLDKNPTAFVDELYDTAHPKWLLVMVMVVIAPIYEEWVFRGVLWSALAEQLKGQQGVWLASIVTSVLFAVIHLQYDVYAMSIIFILALLLSYARSKSGSLLLPMMIHIANNGIAMWQYLSTVG